MPIEDEGWSNLLDFMALMRSAQEAERTGVARRLHDEVGQTLAAFRMRCYGLETRHPQIADELQGLLPSLDDAISVVRAVCRTTFIQVSSVWVWKSRLNGRQIDFRPNRIWPVP